MVGQICERSSEVSGSGFWLQPGPGLVVGNKPRDDISVSLFLFHILSRFHTVTFPFKLIKINKPKKKEFTHIGSPQGSKTPIPTSCLHLSSSPGPARIQRSDTRETTIEKYIHMSPDYFEMSWSERLRAWPPLGWMSGSVAYCLDNLGQALEPLGPHNHHL